MLVKDLIKDLEALIARHEKMRYYKGEDMMGEASIHIDTFQLIDDGFEKAINYEYAGASSDIKITPSEDCCLNILTAFADVYKKSDKNKA